MNDPRDRSGALAGEAAFDAVRRPSRGFLRAAVRERAVLLGRRERLEGRRRTVLARVHELEQALATVDERVAVLGRLIGDRHAASLVAANGRPDMAADVGARVLRGAAIREAAVRTLCAHAGAIEALHYREWYELVRAAGYTIAGSDPLAVFLTQLSRSPVVARSTAGGVYAIDPGAADRLRRRCEQLRAELNAWIGVRTGSAPGVEQRGRRRALHVELARCERQLEEAEWTLRAGGADGSAPSSSNEPPPRREEQ